MNTWPGGTRHAMDQRVHARWNAARYPGTRQLCIICEQPTGRCEEDAMFIGEIGPICELCRANEEAGR